MDGVLHDGYDEVLHGRKSSLLRVLVHGLSSRGGDARCERGMAREELHAH